MAEAAARARALGAFAVNPSRRGLKARHVRKLKTAGFEVYPYTVDRPRRMRRLLDAGVDGLFTNDPARLRRVIDARARHGPSRW